MRRRRGSSRGGGADRDSRATTSRRRLRVNVFVKIRLVALVSDGQLETSPARRLAGRLAGRRGGQLTHRRDRDVLRPRDERPRPFANDARDATTTDEIVVDGFFREILDGGAELARGDARPRSPRSAGCAPAAAAKPPARDRTHALGARRGPRRRRPAWPMRPRTCSRPVELRRRRRQVSASDAHPRATRLVPPSAARSWRGSRRAPATSSSPSRRRRRSTSSGGGRLGCPERIIDASVTMRRIAAPVVNRTTEPVPVPRERAQRRHWGDRDDAEPRGDPYAAARSRPPRGRQRRGGVDVVVGALIREFVAAVVDERGDEGRRPRGRRWHDVHGLGAPRPRRALVARAARGGRDGELLRRLPRQSLGETRPSSSRRGPDRYGDVGSAREPFPQSIEPIVDVVEVADGVARDRHPPSECAGRSASDLNSSIRNQQRLACRPDTRLTRHIADPRARPAADHHERSGSNARGASASIRAAGPPPPPRGCRRRRRISAVRPDAFVAIPDAFIPIPIPVLVPVPILPVLREQGPARRRRRPGRRRRRRRPPRRPPRGDVRRAP